MVTVLFGFVTGITKPSTVSNINEIVDSQPSVVTILCDEERFDRISESIQKASEVVPKRSRSEICECADRIASELHPNQCQQFVSQIDKKQVTFALSDEIIRTDATSESECSRLGGETNPFQQDRPHSLVTQEINFSAQRLPNVDLQSSSSIMKVGTSSRNAEPSILINSDTDSDTEEYASLSCSVTENNETYFVGGTPLMLEKHAIQLENSWLNWGYMSPSLENTRIVASESELNLPLSRKSLSETIIPVYEESGSETSENFASVNSTLSNLEDVEEEKATSYVMDQSFDLEELQTEKFELYGMPVVLKKPNRVSGNEVCEFELNPQEASSLAILGDTMTEDYQLGNSEPSGVVVVEAVTLTDEQGSVSMGDEFSVDLEQMDTSSTSSIPEFVAQTREMSMVSTTENSELKTIVEETENNMSVNDHSSLLEISREDDVSILNECSNNYGTSLDQTVIIRVNTPATDDVNHIDMSNDKNTKICCQLASETATPPSETANKMKVVQEPTTKTICVDMLVESISNVVTVPNIAESPYKVKIEIQDLTKDPDCNIGYAIDRHVNHATIDLDGSSVIEKLSTEMDSTNVDEENSINYLAINVGDESDASQSSIKIELGNIPFMYQFFCLCFKRYKFPSRH